MGLSEAAHRPWWLLAGAKMLPCARFSDQLMAGAMSQGGDSGSAVLDDRKRLVGLLFAGSDTTFGNPTSQSTATSIVE